MKRVKVNPTFRIDVDGRLFKNKHSVQDIQDSIILNNLFTRLSISKGDLVYFPNLGLKQYLGQFNFATNDKIAMLTSAFEEDLTAQMNRECRVHYELDADNKHVSFSLEIDGLEYPVNFVYSGTNDSIRVIQPQFTDEE